VGSGGVRGNGTIEISSVSRARLVLRIRMLE
jgi:hypothetical protein